MDYSKLHYGEPTLSHKWSEREIEFYRFATIVLGHVDKYTIPQYGDKPDDEVEEWSADQCIAAVQKYTKRFASGQRGRIETLRDCAKMAHFAAIAFFKMQPTEEEILKVKGGEI